MIAWRPPARQPQAQRGKGSLKAMGKLLDRLRQNIRRQQARRKAPSSRELDARRSARQQFFEATRNVGVIVLATCFTAGKSITNPSVTPAGAPYTGSD
ncbi:hypothetical protein [Kushneria aurantia]|uniref:Uncharacterized protein n=1 Tax=Kushneria aurantia TaxID=504092 RepID=A0ABV6G139_9GAMM|nr:hypothetical protein [Kushneria aurantia]